MSLTLFGRPHSERAKLDDSTRVVSEEHSRPRCDDQTDLPGVGYSDATIRVYGRYAEESVGIDGLQIHTLDDASTAIDGDVATSAMGAS